MYVCLKVVKMTSLKFPHVEWDRMVGSIPVGLWVKRLMLADQSPGSVTPLLRHLSLPYLLYRPPSQRKHRPMISACSTKALICQAQASYFLSRHGEVALNLGVVERKPVCIAWMGLKSNKSFLFFLKFLLLYCTYARLLFVTAERVHFF